VLLVTLGSVGADRLGCYGNEEAHTPRLDELAARGVRFERALSPSALAPVSQASLLSGELPNQHGLRGLRPAEGHLPRPGLQPLPHRLQARGWRTAAFVSAYTLSEDFGLDRGYQHFSSGMRGDVVRRAQRRGDETTDQALTWLEEYGDEGPWHLWVHYSDAHDRALVPPDDFRPETGVDLDEAGLELAFVDQQVARLLEHLETSGQEESTVVVVVGLHGRRRLDLAGDPGWSPADALAEEALRVPWILRWPEGPRGEVVPELVGTVDLLPTLLEVLELEETRTRGGSSVLPLLRGQLDEPRLVHAEDPGPTPATSDDRRCLRSRRYELVQESGDPESAVLYDRELRPGERVPVEGEEPAEAARLRRALVGRGASAAESRRTSGDAPDRELLSELGYGGPLVTD